MLLSHAELIVGNSSCGVREAPALGTACVDVGTRQQGRAKSPWICSVGYEVSEILEGIEHAGRDRTSAPDNHFGQPATLEEITAAFLNIRSAMGAPA